jgi:hypothetical protein
VKSPSVDTVSMCVSVGALCIVLGCSTAPKADAGTADIISVDYTAGTFEMVYHSMDSTSTDRITARCGEVCPSVQKNVDAMHLPYDQSGWVVIKQTETLDR